MKCHPYEIRVGGILSEYWTEWFGGLNIYHEEDEPGGQAFSTLSGSLDQAALHGVLMKIRDMGAPLIAVHRLDEEGERSSDGG
jgi:hypothetical protein